EIGELSGGLVGSASQAIREARRAAGTGNNTAIRGTGSWIHGRAGYGNGHPRTWISRRRIAFAAGKSDQ
ncbi:MAG: hypothetical protein RL750_135, partial [Bacteroidota bacterium]